MCAYNTPKVQAPDASLLVKPELLDGDDYPAATFVDTVEALDAMIADIVEIRRGNRGDDDDGDGEGTVGGGRGSGTGGACREIAVDLEHHSFRYRTLDRKGGALSFARTCVRECCLYCSMAVGNVRGRFSSVKLTPFVPSHITQHFCLQHFCPSSSRELVHSRVVADISCHAA